MAETDDSGEPLPRPNSFNTSNELVLHSAYARCLVLETKALSDPAAVMLQMGSLSPLVHRARLLSSSGISPGITSLGAVSQSHLHLTPASSLEPSQHRNNAWNDYLLQSQVIQVEKTSGGELSENGRKLARIARDAREVLEAYKGLRHKQE